MITIHMRNTLGVLYHDSVYKTKYNYDAVQVFVTCMYNLQLAKQEHDKGFNLINIATPNRIGIF